MKSILVLSLLMITGLAHSRIVVEKCVVNVRGTTIEAMTHANKYMQSSSTARMITKVDGKEIVNTPNEAQYQYAYGPKALELIQSEPLFASLAKLAKASKNEIENGLTVYTYGNFSDDGAGVVLIAFNQVKGKRKSVIFHGWGGSHICQSGWK